MQQSSRPRGSCASGGGGSLPTGPGSDAQPAQAVNSVMIPRATAHDTQPGRVFGVIVGHGAGGGTQCWLRVKPMAGPIGKGGRVHDRTVTVAQMIGVRPWALRLPGSDEWLVLDIDQWCPLVDGQEDGGGHWSPEFWVHGSVSPKRPLTSLLSARIHLDRAGCVARAAPLEPSAIPASLTAKVAGADDDSKENKTPSAKKDQMKQGKKAVSRKGQKRKLEDDRASDGDDDSPLSSSVLPGAPPSSPPPPVKRLRTTGLIDEWSSPGQGPASRG